MHTYTYVYICIHMHIYIYMHMYIYTYICTYIHITHIYNAYKYNAWSIYMHNTYIHNAVNTVHMYIYNIYTYNIIHILKVYALNIDHYNAYSKMESMRKLSAGPGNETSFWSEINSLISNRIIEQSSKMLALTLSNYTWTIQAISITQLEIMTITLLLVSGWTRGVRGVKRGIVGREVSTAANEGMAPGQFPSMHCPKEAVRRTSLKAAVCHLAPLPNHLQLTAPSQSIATNRHHRRRHLAETFRRVQGQGHQQSALVQGCVCVCLVGGVFPFFLTIDLISLCALFFVGFFRPFVLATFTVIPGRVLTCWWQGVCMKTL